MITKTIPYVDEDILLEGFVAYPASEKYPLVILCHAWRGRDDLICEKAKRLSALGYVGFALDMYGKGILGGSEEENAALKKPFLEDRSFLQRRLLKGFNAACALPWVDSTRVAVLGFGFGAVCALDLARSGVDLKGAISVYGHFDPPRNCSTHPIQAKILILHGYNDPVSPMDDLLIFQEELNNGKVDWQTHIYGNTFHAFASHTAHNPKAGILYNPSSARRAWDTIESFLKEIL